MRISKINAAFFGVLLLLLPLAVFAAEPAPNFKLPTFKSEINLSSYRGRVVYVDFWASWCEPCRKSFPWMDEIQARYGKDLKVIAINLDQERADAVGFLKKLNPKFTIAFDPAGKVAEVYQVKGMPSSYLIDQRGRIVASHIGFRSSDKEKLESHIQKLLAKQQASTR